MRASPSSVSSQLGGRPQRVEEHLRRSGAAPPAGRRRAASAPSGPASDAEPSPARLAAHPPHDLADQVPVGIGVVRVPRPRVATRARSRPTLPTMVSQSHRSSFVNVRPDGRHTGPVAQGLAHGRRLLALLANSSQGPEATGGASRSRSGLRRPGAAPAARRTACRPSTCRPGCRGATDTGTRRVGPTADEVDHTPSRRR